MTKTLNGLATFICVMLMVGLGSTGCSPQDTFDLVINNGLILVDGNPLENLDLIADPADNFVVIMKNGEIYKNTLQ